MLHSKEETEKGKEKIYEGELIIQTVCACV